MIGVIGKVALLRQRRFFYWDFAQASRKEWGKGERGKG